MSQAPGSVDPTRLRDCRVLITGADGMLGRAFVEAFKAADAAEHVRACARGQLDVTDARAVMLQSAFQPQLIIHCAALSIADDCEREPERARLVHVEGTRNVGRLALETGARVFYPQSFLIFDGTALPVTESTRPAPAHVYGRLKLEAEDYLLSEVPGTLVARLAGFFGGEEKDKNFVGKFVRHVAALLGQGTTTLDVGDRVWQPTWTLDIAGNVLALMALEQTGIYNISSHGEATFHDVAQACVDDLGLATSFTLQRISSEVFDNAEAARRPSRVVMTNARLVADRLDLQRPWRVALREYLQRPYFDQFRRERIDS